MNIEIRCEQIIIKNKSDLEYKERRRHQRNSKHQEKLKQKDLTFHILIKGTYMLINFG